MKTDSKFVAATVVQIVVQPEFISFASDGFLDLPLIPFADGRTSQGDKRHRESFVQIGESIGMS